jgi:ATP phosphoribosyltransferase
MTFTLAIPSKGRLMEDTIALLARAGYTISRDGSDRGYRGKLEGAQGVEIAFLSASEIVHHLRAGKVDAGVTGEDLIREYVPSTDETIEVSARLKFGAADVIVAVPECWLDVAAMSDLDDVAEQFYRATGRRMRVATKYKNLTRRFFAEKGVTGYRIVDSSGATEGAPAAGTAELIVDITSTGSTLRANQLKVLDDGLMLQSCAVLAVRQSVAAQPQFSEIIAKIQKHVV